MDKFKYTAVNLEKKKFNGTFMAEDERDLAKQLSKQGLFLVSCSKYTGKTPSAFFTTGTGQVSTREICTFCRQFSIMIKSGISVVESLEVIKEQAFSSYFKSILRIVYDDVKTGIMLSDAINKHASVFPTFFRNMIYVGEVSGNLSKVFESLADYYERDDEIKAKTKSAFSYPIVLAILTIAIVVLMLVFVIPTFRSSLSSLEIVPTGFTKVVYDISDFLTANWLIMLAIIVVIGTAIVIFGLTVTGRYFFDWLKLKTPLIKNTTLDLITARFSRAFSLMLSSGVDIVEALDTIVLIIGNKYFEKRLRAAVEEVKRGESMTNAFNKYDLFPPLLMQMLAVGERTATVADVLERSCGFFDTQYERTLESVTGKIQPIMLLIMGAVIGSLFLAIYSPMLDIMTNLV
ncbi:MAG: type II secretion system F family protein [Firmicutes bacterium]|nr:type II secretion system F family protein [Candidatus Colimorpha enterica]